METESFKPDKNNDLALCRCQSHSSNAGMARFLSNFGETRIQAKDAHIENRKALV